MGGAKKVIRTYTPKTQSVPGWWFGTFFIFHILGIIIPTDFHMFQRDRLNHQPVKIAVVFHGTIPTGVSSCFSAGHSEQEIKTRDE